MRLEHNKNTSILDTTLAEILDKNPCLARMTPREIVNRLMYMKCRLKITPGHPCGQQLPFVTFKSVEFTMGAIFVLDSCLWYDERWVIRMDLDCAIILCVSPVRVIQAALGQSDLPVLAVAPAPEICKCMDIIPAARYLELVREHGTANTCHMI